MRALDVPLPAIAEILTGAAATVDRVLRAERDRLEGELTRRLATLRTLGRLLDEGLLRRLDARQQRATAA